LIQVQHPGDPALDPLDLLGDRLEAARFRGRELMPLAFELPPDPIGVAQ
jgi:hypothetical protein